VNLDYLKNDSSSNNWRDVLCKEIESDYFKKVRGFIKKERSAGKLIYPADEEVFNALRLTPLDKVKVVVLGQDPYHGPGQAHGLCFSVKPGIPLPPSLINIYKELSKDLNCDIPKSGCLTKWAEQGVFLLNAVLTVEDSRPGSHANIGWQKFTDSVIDAVNKNRDGVVFLLWGAYAQKKSQTIDSSRHHILTAPHPSPLSARRGFFGCRHFSKTNELLSLQGNTEINWSL
jgi:uracil-DNA glycosylase